MSSAQQKYIHLDEIDAIIKKSWAVGGTTPCKRYEMLLPADTSETPGDAPGETARAIQKVLFPPALWKIADEIVVNALDHVVRCHGTAHIVKRIEISFDPATGVVSVLNDGPGIEIEIHEEYSAYCGVQTWIPTMIFGVLNQGSNHHANPATIIGGVNGLGGKATNCFSSRFLVQTSDALSRQTFSQEWTGHMREVARPTIKPWAKTWTNKRAFTSVSFLPDYDLFRDIDGQLPDRTVMSRLLHSRAIFAAAYAGFASGGTCSTYYNGSAVPVSGLKTLISTFFPNETAVQATIKPLEVYEHQKYPWDVAAVIMPTDSEFSACTIVNGIIVRSGTHITFIRRELIAGVRAWYSEHYKNLKITGLPGKVESNVFIMAITQIPAPQWDGQRKENMSAPRKFKGYSLPAGFIAKVAEHLKPVILDKLAGYKPPKPKHDISEKYIAAKLAGKKDGRACSLFIVEGDSVRNHIIGPMTKHLGRERYGIIDTRGVPMNSRKHATREVIGGVGIVCPDEKFEQNKFLTSLYHILGLNYNYSYDPANPQVAEKELAQLNYGHIVACVDQDHDGKGNILALISGYIEQFWPHLFARGYIRWLQTPIIRVYPLLGYAKQLTVKEFYDVEAHHEWEAETPAKIRARYDTPIYYKGVGSHSDREIDHIFKTYSARLITIYADARTAERYDVFLGTNPNTRKRELSEPYRGLTKSELEIIDTRKLISASRYLETDVKQYQLDNQDRKLPCVVDGLNQVGRKILEGLIQYHRKHKSRKERVSVIAGFISARTAYQHGETSMFDAIRGKGFIGCGGRQLPIIEIRSNFGTRLEGGADASPPRYVYCALNHRLVSILFPDEDYADLPVAYDEGTKIEPKYFAPIVPMVILESLKIPTHGWKNETWAQCVYSVIEIVKYAIFTGDDVELPMPRLCTYSGTPYAWTGQLVYRGGTQYSVGCYTLDEAAHELIITELPLRKWTTKYCTKLIRDSDPEIVVLPGGVTNESDKHTVNVKIRLMPGALDRLAGMHPELGRKEAIHESILEHFKLRSPLTHDLNFMSVGRDKILSYGSDYRAPIREWFKIRKEHYMLRAKRARILLDLQIMYQEQLIKYVHFSADSPLARKRRDEMVRLLAANGFVQICVSALANPREIPTNKLVEAITGAKATYEYLLSLGDVKKSSESLEKYQAKLDAFRAQRLALDVQERFPGAALWIRELNELEQVIREGSARGWESKGSSEFKFD